MVQKGVWLKSELSFNVHSAGGHLVIKRGCQSDLLFNIFDVSHNKVIVHRFATKIWVRHPLEPLKWHPKWLYYGLHPNFKNWGHFDLPSLYPSDLWHCEDFNLDLSQAPFGTIKITPHLTILRLISKLSKWRSPMEVVVTSTFLT